MGQDDKKELLVLVDWTINELEKAKNAFSEDSTASCIKKLYKSLEIAVTDLRSGCQRIILELKRAKRTEALVTRNRNFDPEGENQIDKFHNFIARNKLKYSEITSSKPGPITDEEAYLGLGSSAKDAQEGLKD